MTEFSKDVAIDRISYLANRMNQLAADYQSEMNVFEAQIRAAKNRYHQQMHYVMRELKRVKGEVYQIKTSPTCSHVTESDSDSVGLDLA